MPAGLHKMVKHDKGRLLRNEWSEIQEIQKNQTQNLKISKTYDWYTIGT